jgi:hypothetical protein
MRETNLGTGTERDEHEQSFNLCNKHSNILGITRVVHRKRRELGRRLAIHTYL